MVKLIACAKDRALGAHIIGADAGTLIVEVVTYMEFGVAEKDIVRTCHAHPTLNKAIKEAALTVEKRTINISDKSEPFSLGINSIPKFF